MTLASIRQIYRTSTNEGVRLYLSPITVKRERYTDNKKIVALGHS